MDIDLVITYVDSSDPEWRKVHKEVCLRERRQYDENSVRFRDWNTLKYILRGTEKYMPWIRRVHLIVERWSQVPDWVRRDRVNVVLHSQIIPMEYLPTYNSTCIEQFMWRIPDLAEHFLYANDDMIPVNPLSPDDFFDGDLPRLVIKNKPFSATSKMYAHHLHNGEALVRRMLGLPVRRNGITRTGHNIAPMLVSTWRLLWDKAGDDIRGTLTTFREHRNVNQELAAYWHKLTGNYADATRTTTYSEMKDVGKVCGIITGTDSQLICINDSRYINYEASKRRVTEAFERKFPDKSKYEL